MSDRRVERLDDGVCGEQTMSDRRVERLNDGVYGEQTMSDHIDLFDIFLVTIYTNRM